MHFTRRQFLYGTTAATAALAFSAARVCAAGGPQGPPRRGAEGPVHRGDIVGVVGAITNAEERTSISAAFGERALGKGVPMTTDSVFNIASMTKAITGSCAMQLVEQGKLELDEPISTYIPRPRNSKFSRAWTKRKPQLRVPARRLRFATS